MAFQSPSSSSTFPLPGCPAVPGWRSAPTRGRPPGRAARPAPSFAPAAFMEGESPSHMVLGCSSHPRRWVKAGCPSLCKLAAPAGSSLRAEGDGGGGSRYGKNLGSPNVGYCQVLGSSGGVPDKCLPQNHSPQPNQWCSWLPVLWVSPQRILLLEGAAVGDAERVDECFCPFNKIFGGL